MVTVDSTLNNGSIAHYDGVIIASEQAIIHSWQETVDHNQLACDTFIRFATLFCQLVSACSFIAGFYGTGVGYNQHHIVEYARE